MISTLEVSLKCQSFDSSKVVRKLLPDEILIKTCKESSMKFIWFQWWFPLAKWTYIQLLNLDYHDFTFLWSIFSPFIRLVWKSMEFLFLEANWFGKRSLKNVMFFFMMIRLKGKNSLGLGSQMLLKVDEKFLTILYPMVHWCVSINSTLLSRITIGVVAFKRINEHFGSRKVYKEVNSWLPVCYLLWTEDPLALSLFSYKLPWDEKLVIMVYIIQSVSGDTLVGG